jgi:tellurite resistance protein TerA
MSVSLTKGSPAVSLTKSTLSGQLHVNLNWQAGGGGGGLLHRHKTEAIDLDLGCLYEFTDGTKGVVQALGDAFTSGGATPVIRLDGDDRSGDSTGGENLFVDMRQLPVVKRILVFTYIYEGDVNWAEAQAVVTLTPQGGEPIVVALDEHDPRSRMVAIALLTNSGATLEVRREVRYVDGLQRQLDAAYGWGLSWHSGHK